MLEKPDLPDELIISCLQQHYGLQGVRLEFLPVGNDASAWVYKVLADNQSAYFLKVKRHSIVPASVLVPYFLHKSGITQVVSAVPDQNNNLWASTQNFVLIMYPFIDGKTGMDVGLSTGQWTQFGTILNRIHSTDLPPWITSNVLQESFVPNTHWMMVIWETQQLVLQATFTDALEQQLAAYWLAHRDEIAHILSRTEELGRLLQAQQLPFVLCHADIHTANLLIDGAGQLFIVDWDGTLFAPKERDLMFVIGGRAADSPLTTAEQAFLKGYGQTTVNWLAMAYYRYEWVVQEIADFTERVFFMPELGRETKQDAVRGFMQLFNPGDVITSAYASETYL